MPISIEIFGRGLVLEPESFSAALPERVPHVALKLLQPSYPSSVVSVSKKSLCSSGTAEAPSISLSCQFVPTSFSGDGSYGIGSLPPRRKLVPMPCDCKALKRMDTKPMLVRFDDRCILMLLLYRVVVLSMLFLLFLWINVLASGQLH